LYYINLLKSAIDGMGDIKKIKMIMSGEHDVTSIVKLYNEDGEEETCTVNTIPTYAEHFVL